MTKPLDVARCEDLVSRIAQGDARAWGPLLDDLWPFWEAAIRRSRSFAALRADTDAVRDVQVALIEKLQRDDARALRSYLGWRGLHADKTFEDWMRIVVANAVRSHLRAVLGPERRPQSPTANGILRDFLVSVDTVELGERPPFTPAHMARKLLAYASDKLPPAQWSALSAWLRGEEFAEIAGEMRLDGGAEEARRLVRAACAVLRRKFAEPAP